MKYKVGDKVKVREDLKLGEMYSMDSSEERNSVVEEMLEQKGRIVTIEDVGWQYSIEEDSWGWTDGMFEGLVEGDEITSLKAQIETLERELEVAQDNVSSMRGMFLRHIMEENKYLLEVIKEMGRK